MWNSLDTVFNGALKGVVTATQLPDVPCNLVKLKALNANPGNIYIGNSTVTKPAGGGDNTTGGLELAPGDETGWIPISNLNKLYRICDSESDRLQYFVLR